MPPAKFTAQLPRVWMNAQLFDDSDAYRKLTAKALGRPVTFSEITRRMIRDFLRYPHKFDDIPEKYQKERGDDHKIWPSVFVTPTMKAKLEQLAVEYEMNRGELIRLIFIRYLTKELTISQ